MTKGNEIVVPEDPESFITGLFEPESLGSGLKAQGLTPHEITEILAKQIRHGKFKDQREAIALLHKMARESLEVSGGVVQGRLEHDSGTGETKHVLTANRLAKALKQKRHVENEARIEEEYLKIQAPVRIRSAEPDPADGERGSGGVREAGDDGGDGSGRVDDGRHEGGRGSLEGLHPEELPDA